MFFFLGCGGGCGYQVRSASTNLDHFLLFRLVLVLELRLGHAAACVLPVLRHFLFAIKIFGGLNGVYNPGLERVALITQ